MAELFYVGQADAANVVDDAYKLSTESVTWNPIDAEIFNQVGTHKIMGIQVKHCWEMGMILILGLMSMRVA